MEREREDGTELIDIGKVTEETKGAWGAFSDEVLMHNMPGLADD